jgi:hypothetical protein
MVLAEIGGLHYQIWLTARNGPLNSDGSHGSLILESNKRGDLFSGVINKREHARRVTSRPALIKIVVGCQVADISRSGARLQVADP